MSKKKKGTGEEISKGRAIANNLYALKTLWKICPSLVVHKAIIRFLGYFEWIFYSAFFMRYVINALEQGEEFSRMMVFLGITVTVFASMTLYNSYLDGSLVPTASPKVTQGLYAMLFKKARNVELSCFEDNEFYDKYTLAMEKADVRLIETVEVVFGAVFGLFASIIAFMLMFSVDKLSVLFIIFPFIGNFVFNRMISKIEYDRNKDMAPHNRKIAYVNRVMYLTDYAKEIRLTKAFSLMQKEYREAIRGVADVTKKYTVKGMILHWLYVTFTFCFIFEGMLFYGAYRSLVSGTISLSQLAVLTSMMVATTWMLIRFTNSLTMVFKNGLFIEYLRTFLTYEEKIPEDTEGEDPGDTIETLEFRHVSFSYKDHEVIKDLNMEFRGGMKYALVGHNGAGKSTIIKLLLRFYDPTEGQILLNGKDIKSFNLQKYRQLFASAFQDNRVLSMSVLDNVLMESGLPAEEGERVAVEALKQSGVYEKVCTLPNGIHTTLTKEFDENGALLSGGEVQKIVVARALVQKSPFKIFDEPSSALDPIAEYQLFENILDNCKNNTLVFISHRLSSMKNADWIYLLEGGGVKEQGTHKKLMAMQGIYADMYTKQARNYLADDSKSFKEDLV